MGTNFLRAGVFGVLTIGALGACGNAGNGAATGVRAAIDRNASPGGAPSGPPQYIVADPSPRSSVVAVPVGSSGALGLVVDKTRILVGRGEPRVGPDVPEQTIAGLRPIPARMGGGFLFWTDNNVYRADTFDGVLRPIARTTDAIQNMSFAPKFALVRTKNGERWALGIPSGERAAVDPLGVSDVEGLDDGRALAFNDSGAAFSSMDSGAHWTDVTSQLHSSPTRVAVIDEELWLYEASGGAFRFEADGHLAAFDKQPPEPQPELRPHDPRWRGAEAPLRTALQSGASVDDSTAIVVEQGDIVRVDVHSGEITGIIAGKLPPDAHCEAVPTANDVLFACVSKGSQSGTPSAFVVSHTLSGDTPTVEQTFQSVATFFGSDDGGLAIASPCTGTPSGPQDRGAVCVRQPGGTWQDYDVSALAGDAGGGIGIRMGSGGSDVNVARWIPRADGRAVAVVLDPTPGIYDPRTGQLESVETAARDVLAQGIRDRFGSYRKLAVAFNGMLGTTLVDWSWSFSSTGSLRGWQPHGGSVEIGDDGKVTRSPYAFETMSAGPYGLGRTEDGRFFQTSDHGGTWTEVAGPPSGGAAGNLRACSTAGCDLGGFYRIGWAARPPRAETPQAPAKLAPEVRRTHPVEMTCRALAPAIAKVLPRTTNSPDDLGLGMSRLPVAGDRSEIAFLRTTIARTIVNPLHEASTGDSDNPALRALLSGFSTSKDGDVFEVMGPNRSASSLRRTVSFVPAFDPAAPVKKAVIATSDVLVAGHAAGLTNDEILGDDMTETGVLVVMTPNEVAAAGDLAFHNGQHGLLVRIKSNERIKLAVRPSQNDSTVISGVALPSDEAAFLELEASGVGHVFKLGAAGITDLFDINPTATNNNDTSFYPANPDALAIGPRGDLAIVRTGSGSDPASALDPALLLVPAMPPVALAPWSTLRLADDASCKEPGWRTTLQVITPWVRVTTPELRTEDLPMLARVKWSEKRVCLEGLEVKLPDVTVRAPGVSASEPLKVASWLVARGNVFARVAIADGVEWRQPLEYTLQAARP